MDARLRYVRLAALTLRNGWYAMGSRSIGPNTLRADTKRRSAMLIMPGEGYGRAAMLSHGYSARVSGKAGSRLTVRTMRTRIRDNIPPIKAPQCGLRRGSVRGTTPRREKIRSCPMLAAIPAHWGVLTEVRR